MSLLYKKIYKVELFKNFDITQPVTLVAPVADVDDPRRFLRQVFQTFMDKNSETATVDGLFWIDWNRYRAELHDEAMLGDDQLVEAIQEWSGEPVDEFDLTYVLSMSKRELKEFARCHPEGWGPIELESGVEFVTGDEALDYYSVTEGMDREDFEWTDYASLAAECYGLAEPVIDVLNSELNQPWEKLACTIAWMQARDAFIAAIIPHTDPVQVPLRNRNGDFIVMEE